MNKVFTLFLYIFAIIGFILVCGFLAIKLGFTKTRGVIDNQHDYFQNEMASSTQAWVNTEEWRVLKQAILKDKGAIHKAATTAHVSPRLLVAPLVVEQLRLFHSEREIFKQVFAPLKILGNQSQFSWGIMGMKQETAEKIEGNLKNEKSVWYLGKEYENMLDFSTSDHDKERFERLTDEHNRYYSYLYAAILIKQIESQWQKAGFPIENRPDIIATLFNIGFENSKPHDNPQSGGAKIKIGKTNYSFGSLAKSFYYSEELLNEFPNIHLMMQEKVTEMVHP